MGIAGDIVVIVLAALIAGVIAQQLRQPIIVGYILVGVLLGPNTGGISISDVHQIEMLAEVGVALLLFALGIEFSRKELMSMRKIAFVGGPLQILLTIGFGYLIGQALGWSVVRSVWLGGLICLSSTMVVLKTLQAKGLDGALSGRIMITILIVQDLAVIPLMVLLPQLGLPGSGVIEVGYAVGRAILLMMFIFVAGTKIVPRVMHYVAAWNSRELFMLATIALALGVGYLTHFFGMSFAFGAFIAGMVLSESDYGHQALSEILSLRDLFGLLFFTSVGMLLDPQILADHLLEIIVMVSIVMFGKSVIIALLTRSLGYGNIAPLAVGFGMSQIGEFSFLLARAGVETGSIDRELYGLTISAAIVTMVLTPYVSALATPLYRLQRRLFPGAPLDNVRPDALGFREHAVIIGGGRVGHQVAGVLHAYGLPFVVLEYEQSRSDKAKQAGFPIIYGDAMHPLVLEAADLHQARLAIVTVPTAGVARTIVKHVREINPKLHIIARSETIEEMPELARLGVHEVIQPEFEAALEMTRQSLLHLDVSPLEIQRFVESSHRDMYQPLYAQRSDGQDLARLRRSARYVDLRWILVESGSRFDGSSIGKLEVRRQTGASVVAMVRDHTTRYNMGPEDQVLAGDWLGVLGTPDAISTLREWASGSATP